MNAEEINFEPQPGPQEQFVSSDADIVIYGGAGGGGKTYGLLLEPLRHIENSEFRGVIFRRTIADIKKQGALLDESRSIYPFMGAVLNETALVWAFPGNMKIQLTHMQHESNKLDWQGAQVPFIGFDELTHFTESQFFYMLSRNRSTSGVPGYVRATCNPDADSWVKKLIQWWIDPTSGYAIQERSGVIRYFMRAPDDSLVWGDSEKDCIKNYSKEYGEPDKDHLPKSLTFIPSSVYDNQKLLDKDPSYIRNLHALPKVERERLLGGNWNIRATSGTIFQRGWFPIEDVAPSDGQFIRYWDRAGTEKKEATRLEKANDPDFTVGMLMCQDRQGIFHIVGIERFQGSPFEVERRIINTARQDGIKVTQWIECDPGQAGKYEAQCYVRALSGLTVKVNPVPKSSKLDRAMPASSQAEAGNIKIVRGHWNEKFFVESENFPDGRFKDQVDCLSGCIQVFSENVTGEWTSDMVNTSGTMAGSKDRNEW